MDPKIAAYIANLREQILLPSDKSATKAAEENTLLREKVRQLEAEEE